MCADDRFDQIASDRQLARRLLTMYRGSSRRRVGGELVRTVAPRIRRPSRRCARCWAVAWHIAEALRGKRVVVPRHRPGAVRHGR